MAAETERLDESNEGFGYPETGESEAAGVPVIAITADDEAVEGHQVQEIAGASRMKRDATTATQNVEAQAQAQPEPSYDHLPPELRPVDGKFPELNESLMRKLRGKYFTVKHPRLQACGHKMDLMNEPRTNCEVCWINFFAYHPKLVEVADEMYRSKGREVIIGMRGKKFVRFFGRFMATLIREQKARDTNNAKEAERGTNGTNSGSENGNTEGQQAGSGIPETGVARGQTEGSSDGGEVAQ